MKGLLLSARTGTEEPTDDLTKAIDAGEASFNLEASGSVNEKSRSQIAGYEDAGAEAETAEHVVVGGDTAGGIGETTDDVAKTEATDAGEASLNVEISGFLTINEETGSQTAGSEDAGAEAEIAEHVAVEGEAAGAVDAKTTLPFNVAAETVTTRTGFVNMIFEEGPHHVVYGGCHQGGSKAGYKYYATGNRI